MAKFYGKIGFESEEETRPGIWEGFVERYYRGDLRKVMDRVQEKGQVNSDITLSNTLSVLADNFMLTHFSDIRYIEYIGIKWAVNSVEVDPPRLTLHIGGIYNA